MTAYLLDTNVFIQAKNLHYGFDFCPAFWEWLILPSNAGKVASIEQVATELYQGDDDLREWAKACSSKLFLKADEKVIACLQEVSSWVEKKYGSAASATFLKGADGWLIAYALAHNYTIVTHEKRHETNRKDKASKPKPKIPNVCEHFNVRYTNPFDMLKNEGAKFVLPTELLL